MNYKRNSKLNITGLQLQDEPKGTTTLDAPSKLAKTSPRVIDASLALILNDEDLLNNLKAFEVEIVVQGSVAFFNRNAENDEEFYVPSASAKFPVFGSSETEVLESEIVTRKVKALVDLLGEQSNLGERIYACNLGNYRKTKFFMDYRGLNGLYYRNQEELDTLLPVQNMIFIQATYVPSSETVVARPILELES